MEKEQVKAMIESRITEFVSHNRDSEGNIHGAVSEMGFDAAMVAAIQDSPSTTNFLAHCVKGCIEVYPMLGPSVMFGTMLTMLLLGIQIGIAVNDTQSLEKLLGLEGA